MTLTSSPAANRFGRAKFAFTLVELLVVIGIIAVLIGVLLPVLGKARGRAQTLACLANLRSITQACVQYTVEYKGSYPWGFTFNKVNPVTGRPSDGGASGYIAWFSSCDKYMTPRQVDAVLLDGPTSPIFGATKRRFSKAFKCPTVPQETFKQGVHYYNNGIIMPSSALEIGLTPAGRSKVTGPMKVNQVYPDNALFWDAPLTDRANDDSPSMFWGDWHTISGAAAFVTTIDDNAPAMSTENALLSHPEFPERRYRPRSGDRMSQAKDPMFASSGPIAWAADSWLQSLGSAYPSANTDFGGNEVWNPGNARFRHNGLGCNVAFVDGSVQTLFLNARKSVKGTPPQTFLDTDFKRYMLQPKWPGGGIKDSGSSPNN